MSWQPLINGFKTYQMLERSFSGNTVEAYLRDVEKIVQFFQLKEWNLSPQQVERKHLEAFLFWLNDLGLGATSQARILSGLRTFYKYLLL